MNWAFLGLLSLFLGINSWATTQQADFFEPNRPSCRTLGNVGGLVNEHQGMFNRVDQALNELRVERRHRGLPIEVPDIVRSAKITGKGKRTVTARGIFSEDSIDGLPRNANQNPCLYCSTEIRGRDLVTSLKPGDRVVIDATHSFVVGRLLEVTETAHSYAIDSNRFYVVLLPRSLTKAATRDGFIDGQHQALNHNEAYWEAYRNAKPRFRDRMVNLQSFEIEVPITKGGRVSHEEVRHLILQEKIPPKYSAARFLKRQAAGIIENGDGLKLSKLISFAAQLKGLPGLKGVTLAGIAWDSSKKQWVFKEWSGLNSDHVSPNQISQEYIPLLTELAKKLEVFDQSLGFIPHYSQPDLL